jgi:hypothetical protein
VLIKLAVASTDAVVIRRHPVFRSSSQLREPTLDAMVMRVKGFGHRRTSSNYANVRREADPADR